MYCELDFEEKEKCNHAPCNACRRLQTHKRLTAELESGGKAMKKHAASKKYHQEKGRRKWAWKKRK